MESFFGVCQEIILIDCEGRHITRHQLIRYSAGGITKLMDLVGTLTCSSFDLTSWNYFFPYYEKMTKGNTFYLKDDAIVKTDGHFAGFYQSYYSEAALLHSLNSNMFT